MIPVYNTEKYLKKCLDTVLSAIDDLVEIILVNDGSSDNSKTICETYEKKNECIRLIDKLNGGSSSARNVGLHVAKGNYITFIDSDDYILPDLYKKFISYLKTADCDVVCVGMQSCKRRRLRKNKFVDKGLEINFINEPTYMHSVCNKAFSRKLLTDNQLFFDEDLVVDEDLLFVFKAMMLARNVNYLDVYPYVYRRDIISVTTNTQTEKMCHDDIETSKRLQLFAEQYNLNDSYKKIYEFRYMTGVVRYITNVNVFDTVKYRMLNTNKLKWNYTFKPSYYMLTVFANAGIDVIPCFYIFIKRILLRFGRGR